VDAETAYVTVDLGVMALRMLRVEGWGEPWCIQFWTFRFTRFWVKVLSDGWDEDSSIASTTFGNPPDVVL
jgi:hypothetical protein